jgi:hypothetical protein
MVVLSISIPNYTLGQDEEIYQNKINWLLDRYKYQEIRGGTTKGLDVQLDINPSEYFKSLQNNNLDNKSKDRLAILSMVGEYRVGFEFLEIFGSEINYKLDKPYQSWGTEMIIAIKDEPDFISLQHIMMMYFKDQNGEITGPYIQKHWRQDWKYEDKNILTYKKNKIWEKLQADKNMNTWSQTVYQVDDSPRYESYGKWIHSKTASRWVSQPTPRPLPRREFSVRNDYDLLSGLNKITIMSWGWVMEEINEKIIIPNTYLGSEYGVARYQRISNYDFGPANEYWDKTKNYWSIVRSKWNEVLSNKRVCLLKSYKDKPLYLYKFNYAEDYKSHQDDARAYRDISNTINNFIDRNC